MPKTHVDGLRQPPPPTKVRMAGREIPLKGVDDSAPDLASVPATARRLGVHPETLYKLIRAGEFEPAVHLGRKVLVSLPRLERYLHGEAS